MKFIDRIEALILKNIEHRVQERLSPKRWTHTKGVVEAAKVLAQLYDADEKQASLAALLHDCAKEMPLTVMQSLASRSGYDVDEEMMQNGALLHGLAGMVSAKEDFGITDPDVLEAIRVHTTGKVSMGLLDKIIFLADYIEKNRDFPGVEALRQMAVRNLDEAVLLGYDMTLRHLLDQELPIYVATIEGRNDLIRSIKESHHD